MMKRYFIALMCLTFPLMTLAYTPTSEDREWLRMVDDRFEDLFPDNVDKLVRIYDALDAKKVEMRVAAGDRGLYLWHKMKKELHHQLFRQSDICIATHAQWGDTVEITYQMHDDMVGSLVRERTTPLAFNPGKDQVWYALEATVLGMQANNHIWKYIRTTGVLPDTTAGTESVRVSTNSVDLPTIEVGKKYVFGIDDVDRVVVGEVIAVSDEEVTFDFSDADDEGKIAISLDLQRLRKGCASE